MTPEQNIDAALDSVLRASGSALRNYTMQKTLDEMRAAMRAIMSDSYIAGSNDAVKILKHTLRRTRSQKFTSYPAEITKDAMNASNSAGCESLFAPSPGHSQEAK